MATAEKETLAKYLKKFDLDIESVVQECGRSRLTINKWFYEDRKMLNVIIKSALTTRYLGHLNSVAQCDD